jgi:tetrapyrrole methylase family protein/MazG family protein
MAQCSFWQATAKKSAPFIIIDLDSGSNTFYYILDREKIGGIAMGSITIIGLGAGAFGLITLETWEKMKNAEVLLLRTAKHPTVAEIKKRGVNFLPLDYMYENGATFDEVYKNIAAEVINRALDGQNVVYGVPGSPLVAERTVVLIRDMAKGKNLPCEILAGMSFVEVLYTRLGIDPIDGLTIIDGGDAADLASDINTAVVITQVYNRQIASDLKLELMEKFGDEYEIALVQNLGLSNEKITWLPLYELDRQDGIDHLTSVFLPRRPTKQARFDLTPLEDVMRTLRSPNGCVWDIEQTHKSLRRYIIEEVYEVIEAIELEDKNLLCEELGDLLLQIVFHARMAEETGDFSMQDVIDGITEKMIRRHPHVFGDISVKDSGEVLLNWEAIKREEKKAERKSLLDGVPNGLPALLRADKLQGKAAKAGFDWDDIAPVWDKLDEEIAELKEAAATGDKSAIEGELGDVLFSVVNLARFLKIDGELALNLTNRKFKERFSYVEKKVQESGRPWQSYTLDELDNYWNEAKRRQI